MQSRGKGLPKPDKDTKVARVEDGLTKTQDEVKELKVKLAELKKHHYRHREQTKATLRHGVRDWQWRSSFDDSSCRS